MVNGKREMLLHEEIRNVPPDMRNYFLAQIVGCLVRPPILQNYNRSLQFTPRSARVLNPRQRICAQGAPALVVLL